MVVYQYSFSFSLLPLMKFYRLLTFSPFIGLQPLDGIKREDRINHLTPSFSDLLSPTPTVNKARAHSGHVFIRGSEFYYSIISQSVSHLWILPEGPMCHQMVASEKLSPHCASHKAHTTHNEAPSAAARVQNLLIWLWDSHIGQQRPCSPHFKKPHWINDLPEASQKGQLRYRGQNTSGDLFWALCEDVHHEENCPSLFAAE